MTAMPDEPALGKLPDDLEGMRQAVQGLLVHRDWVKAYGIPDDKVRSSEQHLRSTTEGVITRALELSSEPISVARAPVDRVLGICRHFTLLHTALLRANGVPARVRCGFSNYFDRSVWCDHWITERWDGQGQRWVRDDPQIDELQARFVKLDFDPYDQPAGQFLTGAEAWLAARAGDVDPQHFGILDMWGLAFIGGNVVADFACLNKVELLPWDAWGMGLEWGPHDTLGEETMAVLDDVARLATSDDFDGMRHRYATDDRLRVPGTVTSFIDGASVTVHLGV